MKIKTPFLVLEIEILFIIVIFISIFSSTFFDYILNYFICYSFILFHELSHMFMASVFGKEIDIFKFSISGVNIKFKEESNKKNINILKEILIYIVGPFSNVFLAMLLKNNIMIFQMNLFLAFINILPIYPLDGYNILRNILYIFFSKKKSNIILECTNKFVFIIMLVIALLQVIFLKNPSIIIFSIYIFFINQNSKKDRRYKEILDTIIC